MAESSPDITSLHFFLWGYVKDIVYRTKVRDINDLHHRIIKAIDTVTVDMLARTWQEIEYRLDVVRATDSAHVPANNAMQGPRGSCKGCPYGTRIDSAAGAVVAPHRLTARV